MNNPAENYTRIIGYYNFGPVLKLFVPGKQINYRLDRESGKLQNEDIEINVFTFENEDPDQLN